jgi:hypothetical protein
MRYRFTRYTARILVALGLTFIVGGVMLSIAAVVAPPSWYETEDAARVLPHVGPGLRRMAVTASIAAGAVVLGAPMILIGQLVLVFFDQRQLLVRIEARLRRSDERLTDLAEDRTAHHVADRYLRRRS